MRFYFTVILTTNVIFLYETGPIHWISSQEQNGGHFADSNSGMNIVVFGFNFHQIFFKDLIENM